MNYKLKYVLKERYTKTDGPVRLEAELLQFADGSVSLEGDEGAIFEGGEDSIHSARRHLEEAGYKCSCAEKSGGTFELKF